MRFPDNPLFWPLMASLILNWMLAHLYCRRALPHAARFEAAEGRASDTEGRLLETAVLCEARHIDAAWQAQEAKKS